jgi:tricarballylate dehydrogenase
MGGGKALVNAYYRSAQALGVQMRYDAPVQRWNWRHGRFVAARLGR